MKIFLDDVRQPINCLGYMFHRIGKYNILYMGEWTVVRNYEEFKLAIKENIGKITHISFDHDLGEDLVEDLIADGLSKRKAKASKKNIKNGLDCAKWMKEFYNIMKIPLPMMFVHSQNPVGAENIVNEFKRG